MGALRAETVHVNGLHARLRQLGAEYQADRSWSGAHIYYARPLKQWLKVTRAGAAGCRVEFWKDCPCSA